MEILCFQKYRFARRPSVSGLRLVEEHSKDNDSGGTQEASPKSRERLPADSSTPEHTKSFSVIVFERPTQDQQQNCPRHTPPRATATDVKLGRSGVVTAAVVHSTGKPTSPSTDSGRTAERRPSLKTPPVTGGAHGGSAAVAISRSPSDSNNNDEIASAAALPFEWTFRNSSAHGGRPPTQFLHEGTRYHPVPRDDALFFSDSPSSPKQSDQFHDDTDTGSTAV